MPSIKSSLQSLPTKGELLYRGDERRTPYLGDVVMTGDPEAVVRVRDLQEVAEVLAYCHGHQVPVTFSAGHTGLTGACAAESGIVIATEHVDQVIDIGTRDRRPYAVAQPGIFLGDLKARVAEEGYFYPPDPTSYMEARLGGTVATNATGEDTFLYGPTRRYIRRLKVIQANGEILELKRPFDDETSLMKGTAGYMDAKSLIDLFIGSEGTLGYLAEVTVDLLPEPARWWAAIGFFPSLKAALDFVVRAAQSDKVSPRALELMDAASLQILQEVEELPPLPDKRGTAIYWKQEYRSESEEERTLQAWYDLFSTVYREYGTQEKGDEIWLARTPGGQKQFRQWRHHIPATINERVNRYRNDGGGKVASDWWVPLPKIQAALHEAIRESEEAGLEPIIFGHIGNGHPHINYLVRNRQQRDQGMELIRRQCERAVRWKGGVAGEHGIGKVHRDLLRVQHSEKVIERMRDIKRKWDPHWILGQGTLFEVP